jgi:thiol-disulfide isomerase/thioredoxin
MVRETSVVTPERYAAGFTYDEYLAQIKVNKNWFQQIYDDFQLQPGDAEFFRKVARDPNGPSKMMVIGEDWCPDVYRGMPVMARIAEASGMEMRVFARDSEMDVMNEFLKEGKWASIPTVVFYTKDHQYICHWIERPAVADREMEEITAKVQQEMPDAQDHQIRAAARPYNQERYPIWQQESVREIREMLASKLGK